MAHTGRYLKPGCGPTSPGIIFSVAVSTDSHNHNSLQSYSERVFKSAVATYTKKREGKWSVPKIIETDNPDELHTWIKRHANKRRRNYVICPIASDVLTLSNWWTYAETKGIKFSQRLMGESDIPVSDYNPRCISVRRCVLRGKPDIMDYVDDFCRYIWLSGIQYLHVDERQIAESIGLKPVNDLFTESDPTSSQLSLIDRALMWSQFLCHLSNWWSENANAPFGLTIGALSMGVLRSYVKKPYPTTHTNEYVSKLERIACYGGRASCWYVGNIGSSPISPVFRNSATGSSVIPGISGPVRQIDVRSMYPYLLANRTFPRAFIKTTGTIAPSNLSGLADYYGCIASVTMWADSPEYPVRKENRITYPRGYIQTVLCGPEIKAIRDKDKILRVHECALYHLGEPYKEAAQAMLDMRVKARAERKPIWEMFSKNIANNMGGKLAQRQGSWVPRPKVAPNRRWGEWLVVDRDNETTIRYRAIAGLVYEYVKDEKGYGPFTSSFAYLTAYGRLHMRDIRKALPTLSVVSQDTDGLWIAGDEAYDVAKQKLSFGNSPGQLQVKDVSQNAVFLGPRHYWTDKGWTLAGFHEHSVNVANMTVTDSYSSNPVWGGVRDTPHTLISRQRQSSLLLDHLGGEVSPDGWVRPPFMHPPRDIDHDS
jgi:hypothetical protein